MPVCGYVLAESLQRGFRPASRLVHRHQPWSQSLDDLGESFGASFPAPEWRAAWVERDEFTLPILRKSLIGWTGLPSYDRCASAPRNVFSPADWGPVECGQG